jgi:hypothetical protein
LIVPFDRHSATSYSFVGTRLEGIFMVHLRTAIFCSLVAVASSRLMAEERFYLVSASRIDPKLAQMLTPYTQSWQSMAPVQIDAGTAYAAVGQRVRALLGNVDQETRALLNSGWVVAIRTEQALPLTGKANLNGKGKFVDIRLDDSKLTPTDRRVFLACQRETYFRLMQQGYTGSSWFRYQVRRLDKKIGTKLKLIAQRQRQFFGVRGTSITDTFALLSGGRALSENLQLGRELPQPRGNSVDNTVDIQSITGITVREFDWSEYVKDTDPELDPLASMIPHDQHALFFTSFDSLLSFAYEAADQGTPILRLAEPQGIDAMTRQRYETQLCLSLNGLAEVLGPQLIDTVAITGGDPYFRTGTDVAVMFTSRQMLALGTLLQVQIRLSAERDPTARPVQGKLAKGTPFTGMKSADDRIRSYFAVINNAIVVSNSITQLERIEQVADGALASLGSLDEYRFFRDRYPRSKGDESGLLIISDATIRRWCSPKWRIATSRRTRVAAVLLDIQAQYLDQIAAGTFPKGQSIVTNFEKAGTTTFVSSSSGLRSEDYGDMRFQTPIMEMDLPRVTAEEQRFYNRWRDGYQRNWSNYFDPIAIRFVTTSTSVGLDMTVMPLIDFSRYRDLISISQGAALDDLAGDPHPEAVIHWVLAVNTESQIVRQSVDLARNFASLPLSPLSWLGNDLSLYVDQDPIWAKLSQIEGRDGIQKFLMENLDGLPVAAQFDVRSGMRLTFFLSAVRAFVNQAAPKMLVWTPHEHNGHAFVRVALSAAGRAGSTDFMDGMAVYYTASGDSFTVSLSETVVKRAIDRIVARTEGKAMPAGPPSLGGNLAFHVDGKTLPLISLLLAEDYQRSMQRVAFSNIPILNEWKRRFPDRDPLEFHTQMWHQRLVCPGGGTYRWNEEFQTMESTVYGHPAAAKQGPGLPPTLSQFSQGDFGLTFEQDGLRVRVQLQRQVTEK